jgi:hypothetical protein
MGGHEGAHSLPQDLAPDQGLIRELKSAVAGPWIPHYFMATAALVGPVRGITKFSLYPASGKEEP